MFKNFIKIGCLLFSFSFIVIGSGDAMFGLRWGMSPSQVRAMGIPLMMREAHHNFSIYKTDTLPKSIKIAESYNLLFENDSALVKIVMVSVTIKNDIYGTEGKEIFEKLVNLMKKKYKQTDISCVFGLDLYEENDEFYECLNYDGCGQWYAFFDGNNKNIIIQLKGLERGRGYIVITVEAVPEFRRSVEKYEDTTNKETGDAF